MFREVITLLADVCGLLPYTWTGIRVDQPFQSRSQRDRQTSFWQSSRRPWPLEQDDAPRRYI